MEPNLVVIISATLAIAVALTRIIAAAKPATDAFIPHRWGWLIPALLAVCSTITLSLPGANTWMDYASIMVGVVAIFAVAAQSGLAKKDG